MTIQLASPPARSTADQRGTTAHPHSVGETHSSARRICDALVRRIGRHKFDMWFAHAAMAVHGKRLEISTDNQFVANWIGSKFAGELRTVAREALGRDVELEVQLRPGSGDGRTPEAYDAVQPVPPEDAKDTQTAAEPIPTARPARRPARESLNHSVATLRRLEDFVVGPSNRLAYSSAVRLAEDGMGNAAGSTGVAASPDNGHSMSPLFIHGECGVGKSHLLQGICRRATEQGRGRCRVRYVTGEQFTNEFITAIRNNSIDEFRRRVRKLDLLAIDDVHFLANKHKTQTEFLYTLEAIDLSGARVVMASDNHPHHIRRFNQALVSRFMSGMVVKVERPDRMTRIALVRRLAQSRGLALSEAAVELIAGHCVGSVRELEGAITKLDAYRMVVNGEAVGGEIGVMLAEKVFRDQAQQPRHIVRLASIVEAVCRRLAVSKADMLGSSRHRRVVLARGVAAYLARELTTHSFPEIAADLGRINHSTIHTADQRLRKQLEANEDLDLGGSTRIRLSELVEEIRREAIKAAPPERDRG